MAKFKKGDLVMIVANDLGCEPHFGKVGNVIEQCHHPSIILLTLISGLPFYHLTCLAAEGGECIREDALKKIAGDRAPAETPETRDEPVTA